MYTFESSTPNALSQRQLLRSSSSKPSSISAREFPYQPGQEHDSPCSSCPYSQHDEKSSRHDANHCAAKRKANITPGGPGGGRDTSSSQYHDFSSAPDIEIPCNTKGGVKVPFPVKLFHLLEHIDLHEPELAKIISWQPHGRCFMTRDVKKMEEQHVLKRFSRQINYSSFRRQLNRWGFKRIIDGPDYGAYYHELFLRGKPYLCRAIERLTSTRKPASSSYNSDEEDDPQTIFHSMPVLPPSFLIVLPKEIMKAEDQTSLSESTQDTEEEQPMMMCTAEAECGHSHTAEHSRNLTVYLIGNSPPATDQETSEIMIFLQKLDEFETCLEQSAEKEHG